MLDALTLLDGWLPAGPAHVRLDRLLKRSEPAASLDAESLGMRNQRVLALHAHASRDPLEAVATCPHCGEVNEFVLPAADLLALPPPAADRVVVDRHAFRLPRMAELLAADPRPLAVRCHEGETDPSAETLVLAGAALDRLDPAANVVVDLTCSACGAAYRASLDIAGFVAASLDRLVARLMQEIDVIAGAYGWTEASIAALPAQRRRRYVEMIVARRAPAGAAR